MPPTSPEHLFYFASCHSQHQCLQHKCRIYIPKGHSCKLLPIPRGPSYGRESGTRQHMGINFSCSRNLPQAAELPQDPGGAAGTCSSLDVHTGHSSGCTVRRVLLDFLSWKWMRTGSWKEESFVSSALQCLHVSQNQTDTQHREVFISLPEGTDGRCEFLRFAHFNCPTQTLTVHLNTESCQQSPLLQIF